MPQRIVTVDGKSYRFAEYDLPPLGANEARIRVEFAAPKHGTEGHVLSGSAFNRKRWDGELRLFVPLTEEEKAKNEEAAANPQERGVGNTIVGTITEIGTDVTRWKVGDRVFGYGQIREVSTLAEDNLWSADGLSPENAVCVDPAHVAFVAVRDGNIRIGDDVAVFGLGAIGLLAVQCARVSGARRIFAVDPVATRRDIAAHFGGIPLDPLTCDVALEIKRATENKGVDVSVETSGNGRAFNDAIRCIRQCGVIVHVPWGPKDATPLHFDEEFHLNRPTIIGSQAVWNNADRSHPLWNQERALHTVANLFREGKLSGEGVVSPLVSFADSLDALALMTTAPDKAVKVGVIFP